MKKNSDRNKERRNKRKRELVEMKGGKCSNGKCGYNSSLSALAFHHRNPKEKSFSISGTNLSKKRMEDLINEVKKCDLVCLNCHAERHDKEGWIHEDGKRTTKLGKRA